MPGEGDCRTGGGLKLKKTREDYNLISGSSGKAKWIIGVEKLGRESLRRRRGIG